MLARQSGASPDDVAISYLKKYPHVAKENKELLKY